jgi:hypothetical protein
MEGNKRGNREIVINLARRRKDDETNTVKSSAIIGKRCTIITTADSNGSFAKWLSGWIRVCCLA